MRREFANVLIELARKDEKVKLLNLDGPGFGLYEQWIKYMPQSHFNLGVTEQASIGVASGMALEGLKPYVYSINPFILERPFEQIKLDIVEQGANVKLVGFWDYPKDGPTHETKNPRGICDILGIRYFEPKNSYETRQALLDTYKDDEPAFFYLTKDNTPRDSE